MRTLTNTEGAPADDENARGPRDALLEPLQPVDTALLRPAGNVKHICVLEILVCDRTPQIDRGREVAAEGVDEEVEVEGAVQFRDSVFGVRLVEDKRVMRYRCDGSVKEDVGRSGRWGGRWSRGSGRGVESGRG